MTAPLHLLHNRHVLIVDDEPNMRRVLEIMLTRQGARVHSAANGREALQCASEHDIELIISDLRMPDLNGIELLRALRQRQQTMPLIMVTAQGSIESAVEAMRLGACDYLLRPFDVEALNLAISRVFATQTLIRQKAFLNDAAARGLSDLVGSSAVMQQVRARIGQVAPTHASVLLTGETGTGKEVAARAIHQASTRAEQLFVPVNCAAIPADLLESELFGHEKGAFTGALKTRIGKFELAHGGTLFLDEITEMPIALQAKLLRVLQEGQLQRLGSNLTLTVDVRIIAASNRPPQQAVQEGLLREDLFYRLNVFGIDMPPLRERLADIPELIQAWLRRQPRPYPSLATAAAEYLQLHHWPGNVRELHNTLERALILSGGQRIELAHVAIEPETVPAAPPPLADGGVTDLGLDDAVQALEIRLIREALQRAAGNKTRAAQLLRISERSIFYKIRKYGLQEPASPTQITH